MKKRLLNIIVLSSSVFIVACGSGDGSSFQGIEVPAIPVNTIQFPVVKTSAYTATDLSDVAASSTILTYKMLGMNGQEVQATALVFTPKTAPPAGGWPIVVWAHGTTGVADICAPSRLALTSSVRSLISELLSNGYVVVAPDYEGLGEPLGDQLHPFLNLKSEAYSITDAVVAMRNLLNTQVSNKWLTVGYSQGGQAVLGAAQYAARANLDYKGTIALAPPSSMGDIVLLGEVSVVDADLNTKIATYASLDSFTALITAGLRNPYPSFQYSTVFKIPTDEIAAQAENLCLDDLGNAFGVAMGAYAASHSGSLDGYPRTQENFLEIPIISDFIHKDAQPAQVKLNKPVIIYQGTLDTIVPKVVTDDLVKDAQSLGTLVTYRTSDWSHPSVFSDNIDNIVADVQNLMPSGSTGTVP